MYYFSNVTYCMLLTCNEVIPYFVRTALKQDPFIPKELADLLALPLNEFAAKVNAADLPDDFYDRDDACFEDFANLCFAAGFSGVLRLLPELVPTCAELVSADPEHWDHLAQYSFDGTDIVHYIPLRHQPSIFANRYHYKDGNEVIAEVMSSVKDLGVELPDDFPYWRVIGVLDGVTWMTK